MIWLRPAPPSTRALLLFYSFTFMEPQGGSHGELNQPSLRNFKWTDLILSRFMAVSTRAWKMLFAAS